MNSKVSIAQLHVYIHTKELLYTCEPKQAMLITLLVIVHVHCTYGFPLIYVYLDDWLQSWSHWYVCVDMYILS